MRRTASPFIKISFLILFSNCQDDLAPSTPVRKMTAPSRSPTPPQERHFSGYELQHNSTYFTPFDHKNLFKRVSTRTSLVPICCSANFRTSLMARGARFLKPLEKEERHSNAHHCEKQTTPSFILLRN